MASTALVMTKAKVAEELDAPEEYVDWLLEEGYLVASFLPSKDGVREARFLRIQRANFRQFISNMNCVTGYKPAQPKRLVENRPAQAQQRTLQQAEDEANAILDDQWRNLR